MDGFLWAREFDINIKEMHCCGVIMWLRVNGTARREREAGDCDIQSVGLIVRHRLQSGLKLG